MCLPWGSFLETGCWCVWEGLAWGDKVSEIGKLTKDEYNKYSSLVRLIKASAPDWCRGPDFTTLWCVQPHSLPSASREQRALIVQQSHTWAVVHVFYWGFFLTSRCEVKDSQYHLTNYFLVPNILVSHGHCLFPAVDLLWGTAESSHTAHIFSTQGLFHTSTTQALESNKRTFQWSLRLDSSPL